MCAYGRVNVKIEYRGQIMEDMQFMSYEEELSDNHKEHIKHHVSEHYPGEEDHVRILHRLEDISSEIMGEPDGSVDTNED